MRRRKSRHSVENSGVFGVNVLTVALCLLTSLICGAQTVPSQLTIGDVKLHINESARKQIQQDVDRLTRSETYYNILVDRMNLYFPLIEKQHRKGGIPDEIKFLAIQESALISDAVSSANAVGFWQFKDFTGREVGLRVDRQVDERLNIVSSSRGSAKYFKTNNFFFDNWAYAVIAYQAGAAGAKAHTDTRNYGSKKLNVTTKTYWYLKKFIAHVVAFTPAVGRPHSEGIWLDAITNAGGKSLEQIAKDQKVDLEELKKYNKWLKRGRVPEDRTYHVLIPRTGPKPKHMVASNQKDRPKKIEKPKEKKYTSELTPGTKLADGSTVIPINEIPAMLANPSDDIHSISAKAGLSVKAFAKYNDISSDQEIIPSKFYFIRKKRGWSKVEFHTVKEGESLWSVAQQYGIRLSSLMKKNRISGETEVKPGRVLWLKKKRPKSEPIAYEKAPEPLIAKAKDRTSQPPPVSEKEAAMQPEEIIKDTEDDEEVEPIVVPVVDSSEERRKVKIHTVAKGETLFAISRLYEVKIDDLLRWNELPNPDAISIGQNIQVKAPIEEISEEKNVITHTVQAGETLYAISRKYNMTVDEVMDLNGMKNFNLDSGQELKVFESSE